MTHNPFSASCWHNFQQHAVPNSTDAGRYWTGRVCHRKSLKKWPKGPTLVMVKGGTGHDSWGKTRKKFNSWQKWKKSTRWKKRRMLWPWRDHCGTGVQSLEEEIKVSERKGTFMCPLYPPALPPTRFTRMWTSRLNSATGWVIVTVHGRVKIPFNFT